MKIVFVSGNLTNGGAQRVISIIASWLAEEGHDVTLLLFCRSQKEYPLSKKVKLEALCKSYEDYSKMPKLTRIRCLREYLKDIKPDVGIGFTEGGYALYLAALGLKFKKVASARIDPKIIMEEKGFRAMVDRYWFFHADAVVLQTTGQLERVPLKIRKRSVVIANPVSDMALQNHCTIDADKCRNIVMVGRLDEQKNYPMAFRAIQIVKDTYPDIHLDVFGKGDLEEKLKQMIEQMNLSANISMRGWTQDALSEYREHDLYLLTSDYEGMPNALMEAMAVGIPCISTDCATGPADLIIDGNNGYLVPVGDSEKLSSKIIELIEMPLEERKKIADFAYATLSEKFNSEVISRKWEQFLKKLIEGEQ